MRSLLITLCFALAGWASAQTNVQGGIYANTTWTLANSPYVMTGSIVVFPGKTLTIQPGVVVKVQNPGPGSQYYLEIRGSLVARGTKTQPIVFKSAVPNDTNKYAWAGILVKGSQGGTVDLNAIHFKNAYHALDNDQVDSTRQAWKHMRFEHNYFGLMYPSPMDVDSSVFYNNDYGLFISAFSQVDTNFITNCRFAQNNVGANGYYSATEFLACDFDSNNYGYFSANPFILSYIGFDDCSFNANYRAMESPGGAWIRSSSFTNNGRGINQANSCIIENCSFTGNEWAADVYNDTYFTDNVVESNENGLTVARTTAWGTLGGVPVVEDNRLCDNNLYNVLNGSDFNLELEKNCFCLSDSAAIDAKIYDGYDDITRGLLNFAVYDTSCTTQLYRVMKVNILGGDEAAGLALAAYPNPVADVLVIEGLSAGDRVQVRSAVGQLMAETEADRSELRLDASAWPRGLYLIHVEGRAALKVLKP
ncbi:MAG: T9SS type A sorting domain-containing protein [Bacteroidetes bacterium]|nr:T9SS type A sorting domain-containing protein [Bacteroidota bacterium]